MSRTKIIEKLSGEYPEFTPNKIKNIVKNRKVIYKNTFRTRKINGAREVIDIDKLSNENQLLLRYYQLLLNEIFQIKPVNRNIIISELLNVCPFISDYNNKCIYKFDIRNFYPSIDIEKVFDVLEKNDQLYPSEIIFLKNTFRSFESFYPGIGIINSFSEIIGEIFDRNVENLFSDHLIYYARYVDDCILIFDEKIEENYIENNVLKLLEDIFGNSVELNAKKTKYIEFNDNVFFDYLGYSFSYIKNNQTFNFKFGIAENKIEKEKNKINGIITRFLRSKKNKEAINKLTFQIDLYYKRLVFYNKNDSKNHSHWEARGISQVYGEIKKYIERDTDGSYNLSTLDKNTKQFLQGDFLKGMLKGNTPPKIVNYINNDRFSANFYNNRAVILNNKVGYSYDKLFNILEECGITVHQRMSYEELANIFLRNLYIY